MHPSEFLDFTPRFGDSKFSVPGFHFRMDSEIILREPASLAPGLQFLEAQGSHLPEAQSVLVHRS